MHLKDFDQNSYAILIVTHNHVDYIKSLIDSCRKIPNVGKYICDAASTDGTAEKLEAEISGDSSFHLIKKDILEGFSKNNNDLVRAFSLHNRNLILINPDCHFEKAAFLTFIERILRIENLGIAAPALYYPNGYPQVSWRKFPSLKEFIKNRLPGRRASTKNHFTKEFQEKTFDIEWALGALLFISKNLTSTPPLDERYRLYCEDSDICMKAHASGMRVIGIDIPGFYHALQEKSSTKFLSKFNYWNLCSGLKFAIKWNSTYLKVTRKLSRAN
ncbi:Glycosyltransferase, GT2 family [Pseudomonas citronellolis]|uniref:Glycosyltransferase, GT2 family n=1 Tax=Pseudomonas citronellolis TaxID=53408 RepID=A0AAQ1KMI4_9PSED|nr:glycosyltransferase [Pseudomonas citronellolis]TGC31027.1 glycosyltransferase family 2 protein [Pseudomonas citronellolis]SFD83361.1 Glycosyltransferase, GT2 family [Pseudomonas citronellolis]